MAKEGCIDTVCRVNQALHKLRGCYAEVNEIERIVTELETDAHSSSEHINERVDLLLVIKTVRDMLNVLATGIERIPGKQGMQVVIQEMNSTEDHASEEDNTRSKRARLSTEAEPSNVCGTSSREIRITKTSGWDGPKICTYTCIHHPQIVNPGLWSKLTEDLVVQVFARLPIARIIGLRKCSKAWSAMSDSSSFKEIFAEANPKLFGLLGWDANFQKFRTRIVDDTSKEWHGIELDNPNDMSKDSCHICDGGLICFVPESKGSIFL
ncbi:hypothetical protein M758_4G223100 [Ceratodon purpureus]|nr:hypothetical protein M758_4G223100 [Ceratodon purpureus]